MKRIIVLMLMCVSLTCGAEPSELLMRNTAMKREWAKYWNIKNDLPKTREKQLMSILDKSVSAGSCVDAVFASSELVRNVYTRKDRDRVKAAVLEAAGKFVRPEDRLAVMMSQQSLFTEEYFGDMVALLHENRERLINSGPVDDIIPELLGIGKPNFFSDMYELSLYFLSLQGKSYGYSSSAALLDSLIGYCSSEGKGSSIGLAEARRLKYVSWSSYMPKYMYEKEMAEAYALCDSCGDDISASVFMGVIEDMVLGRAESEDDYLQADSLMNSHLEWARLKVRGGLEKAEEEYADSFIKSVEGKRNMLRSKSIYVDGLPAYPSDCRLKVVSKNVSRFSIVVRKDEKKLWSGTFENPHERFAVLDTFFVSLPSFNDGLYMMQIYLEGDEEPDYIAFFKTASLASAVRDGKYYLVEAESGRPVTEAGYRLYDSRSGEMKSEGDVSFCGFTPLKIGEDLLRYDYNLVFELPDGRRSADTRLYQGFRYDTPEDTKIDRMDFFLDKSIFKPGETVRFKLVSYGYDAGGLVFDTSSPVRLRLCAPDGSELASKDLTTNDFGSASGEFILPESGMNGIYRILTDKGNGISFRVETVELPSFDVVFFPVDTVYVCGDTVSVRGAVKSYRGYDVSGVRVSYSVNDSFSEGPLKGEVYTDSEGRFAIPVGPVNYYTYIDIVASLPEGESLGASYALSADEKGISVNVVPDNVRSFGDAMSYASENTSFYISVSNSDGVPQAGAACRYRLYSENSEGDRKVVLEGSAVAGDTVKVDWQSLCPGKYIFSVSANAGGDDCVSEFSVSWLDKVGDDYPDMKDEYFFMSAQDGSYVFGAKDSIWVLREIFDRRTGRLLDSASVLYGRGVHRENDAYIRSFRDRDVVLSMFFVKDGSDHCIRNIIEAQPRDYDLDMDVVSYRKMTGPSAEESFVISFAPGTEAEVLVDIFDKSSEQLAPNVYRFSPQDLFRYAYIPFPYVFFGGRHYPFYGYTANDMAPVMKSLPASAESLEADRAAAAAGTDVRSDFSTTLAFMPSLRPDKEGKIVVDYKTSDKLSTFVLQILAYDKDFNSRVFRDEIIVRKDLAVSSSVPQFLSAGDSLVLRVSVRNDRESSVKGFFWLEVRNPELVFTYYGDTVSCGAGAAISEDIPLPPFGDSSGRLAVRYGFRPDDSAGDGEERMVSVVPSEKVHTEAVTAFVADGGDAEIDISSLLADTASAVYAIDISDPMSSVLEAVPSMYSSELVSLTDWVDALVTLKILESRMAADSAVVRGLASLSNAGSADYDGTPWKRMMEDVSSGKAMADSLVSDEWRNSFKSMALDKISSYVCADGSMSWMPGGVSSVYMTMSFLYRYAMAELCGAPCMKDEAENVSAAVSYLDGYFTDHIDRILGGRCLGSYTKKSFVNDGFVHKYMFIRSFFRNDVPLTGKAMKYYRKCERLMSSEADKVPVSEKILFANVLLNGDRYSASGRLARILASVYEHMGEDSFGNLCLKPGARFYGGVLDGEVFVNSVALDLFGRVRSSGLSPKNVPVDDIIDGLCRHLLVLKDGTFWEGSFNTATAAAALFRHMPHSENVVVSHKVLSASDLSEALHGDGSLYVEQVPENCFVTVTKTGLKKISDIGPDGNMMGVSRVFERKSESSEKYEPLCEGDVLRTGDVVRCRYVIRSEERRSFVRLRAMRAASFAPVDKYSGYSYRPFFGPSAYRDIQVGHTDYWIDELPEGKTVITEEHYVVSSGVFSAGVVEAESVYSPKYRAVSEWKAVSSEY